MARLDSQLASGITDGPAHPLTLTACGYSPGPHFCTALTTEPFPQLPVRNRGCFRVQFSHSMAGYYSAASFHLSPALLLPVVLYEHLNNINLWTPTTHTGDFLLPTPSLLSLSSILDSKSSLLCPDSISSRAPHSSAAVGNRFSLWFPFYASLL